MSVESIESLIRRNSVVGMVDAERVLKIAEALGADEKDVHRVRRTMGYKNTINTRLGKRWTR